MNSNNFIKGFSKLTKKEKLHAIAQLYAEPAAVEKDLKNFWHPDESLQTLFDELSENTITNFFLPFGIIPNVVINDKTYFVPAVIEESSVIAAAAKSAKFWAERGGFHAEVLGTEKIGQVHFIWTGDGAKLKQHFPALKSELIEKTRSITENMKKRGGGILDITLVDLTDQEDGLYQLKATFDTCDSMGANFVNSCLEEFAEILKEWMAESGFFSQKEADDLSIIMCILSNYTPNCLVKVWVECPIADLAGAEKGMSAEEFVWKFQKGVRIAEIDVHRATTHNKGIYNGIDAVVLATGNDFRAIEAVGHAYAAKDGKYTSLTSLSLENGIFKYTLTAPMALGVVGGLTNLHPVVKRGLELLGKPSAQELMMITAAIGLANNFGAVRSLVTSGIQKGHMKMHLVNILNTFKANEEEKTQAFEHFKENKVSYSEVRNYLDQLRAEN